MSFGLSTHNLLLPTAEVMYLTLYTRDVSGIRSSTNFIVNQQKSPFATVVNSPHHIRGSHQNLGTTGTDETSTGVILASNRCPRQVFLFSSPSWGRIGILTRTLVYSNTGLNGQRQDTRPHKDRAKTSPSPPAQYPKEYNLVRKFRFLLSYVNKDLRKKPSTLLYH